MDENGAAVALTAWCRAVLPELVEGRHFISGQKTRLPDVMAEVVEKTIALSDPRFPDLNVQQAALRVFEAELSFMVAHDDAQADREESEQLRDFGQRLEASLLSDSTLGGRVFMASPLASFDYRLPFVQYADGTRGRQMTLTLAVAEPIQPQAGF